MFNNLFHRVWKHFPDIKLQRMREAFDLVLSSSEAEFIIADLIYRNEAQLSEKEDYESVHGYDATDKGSIGL